MNTGLIYVSDQDPGIARHRHGRGFTYVAPDGTTISRGPERKRIEALAVPPAYEDVWICPKSNGHLQATGRDAKRRKQYRYHPDWSNAQAETKFDQLVDFAEFLPRIRARVKRDLDTAPGDQTFALAAAVYLIDRAALRVGNAAYTRENGSYGALTLQSKHLHLKDDGIALRYIAKGGAKVRKKINDGRLQRLLQRVNELPGATLLTWDDDEGTSHTLSSQQLNAHIGDVADIDGISAKTFRTWAGTLAAFEVAEQGGATIKDLAQAASARLHNTPTVARNSYIHPAIIGLAGQAVPDFTPVTTDGLRVTEQQLLGFLRDW